MKKTEIIVLAMAGIMLLVLVIRAVADGDCSSVNSLPPCSIDSTIPCTTTTQGQGIDGVSCPGSVRCYDANGTYTTITDVPQATCVPSQVQADHCWPWPSPVSCDSKDTGTCATAQVGDCGIKVSVGVATVVAVGTEGSTTIDAFACQETRTAGPTPEGHGQGAQDSP